MRRPSALIAMLLVFFIALFTGGCRTVNLDATGQNQAAFNYGKFEMIMGRPAKPLADASEAAFREMDLFLVSKKVEDFSAELKARTRQDKLVTVTIKEINSRQTMLYIKVGMRGDLKLSRALYERIEGGASQTGSGNRGGQVAPSRSSGGSPIPTQ